jgi:hypothetical protein
MRLTHLLWRTAIERSEALNGSPPMKSFLMAVALVRYLTACGGKGR